LASARPVRAPAGIRLALDALGGAKFDASNGDVASDLRDASWRGGHVHGQLSERHRLRVRLPSELVARHALEHPARRLCFLFEFLYQGFNHRHGVLLLQLTRLRSLCARTRSSSAVHPRPIPCR
jgi:hypothetical protein